MTVKIRVINWRPKYVFLFPNSLRDAGRGAGSDNISLFLFLGLCSVLVEEGTGLFLNSGSKSAKRLLSFKYRKV